MWLDDGFRGPPEGQRLVVELLFRGFEGLVVPVGDRVTVRPESVN